MSLACAPGPFPAVCSIIAGVADRLKGHAEGMSRLRDRPSWEEQRAAHAELWRMLRREPEQERGWRDFWKVMVPLLLVVLAVGALWHPPFYVALGLIAALGFRRSARGAGSGLYPPTQPVPVTRTHAYRHTNDNAAPSRGGARLKIRERRGSNPDSAPKRDRDQSGLILGPGTRLIRQITAHTVTGLSAPCAERAVADRRGQDNDEQKRRAGN